MKQRIVLWGALGALAVGAGALVTVSTLGGDDDAPPALPLALAGSAGAAADAAAAAESLTIAPGPTSYVAGEGLPELGGEAEAHRLPAEVSAGEVADLADALGIDGEPAAAQGAWTVADDQLTLTVVPVTGTWSAYRSAVPEPAPAPMPGDGATSPGSPGSGGASGAEGEDVGAPVPADPMPREAEARATGESAPTTIVCVTTPCEPAPADDVPVEETPVEQASEPCAATDCISPVTTAASEPCTATTCPGAEPVCPDDPTASCVTACAEAVPEGGGSDATDTAAACAPAEPLPGLPSEDGARDQAVALLEATGLDVADAAVEAVGGVANWTVSVEPRLAGVAAPGLAGYVTVGPDGVVESASGPLLPAESLGEYPLLTTAGAIDRLNEPGDVSVASPGGPAVDVPAEQPTSDAGPAGSGASATDSGTDSSTGGAAGGGVTGSAGDVQGLRTQTTPAEGPPMTPGTAMPPDGFPTTPTSAPTTGTAVATPTDPSAPTTGAVLPTEPVPLPEPQPTEVVLVDAELVYLAVASWDGSGTYLVPGYRFTPADAPEGAEGPTVPAIEDDALAPPVDTATTEPADTGSGVPEPGAIEPAVPSTTTGEAGG